MCDEVVEGGVKPQAEPASGLYLFMEIVRILSEARLYFNINGSFCKKDKVTEEI